MLKLQVSNIFQYIGLRLLAFPAQCSVRTQLRMNTVLVLNCPRIQRLDLAGPHQVGPCWAMRASRLQDEIFSFRYTVQFATRCGLKLVHKSYHLHKVWTRLDLVQWPHKKCVCFQDTVQFATGCELNRAQKQPKMRFNMYPNFPPSALLGAARLSKVSHDKESLASQQNLKNVHA